jgi:hypothetical protein
MVCHSYFNILSNWMWMLWTLRFGKKGVKPKENITALSKTVNFILYTTKANKTEIKN